MKWRDRQGNIVPGEDTQNRLLSFLYNTAIGRAIVSILIKPWVSNTAGHIMDSRISCIAIKPFLKRSHIDMNEYEQREFRSFNDFFTRQIQEGMRPVDMTPTHLVSPCDCKLSVYSISEDLTVQIKGTEYTMETLLRDRALAAQYIGGIFLLFRLTKEDYHRYCYIDDGVKSENIHIPGVYHTVNPVAGEYFPVYRENTREYSILKSEHFGSILMMEVGATMVGRIVNYQGAGKVCRGQEKGRFEFGGSTVILCLQKGAAVIDGDLIENTRNGIETVVNLGEKIGSAPTKIKNGNRNQ